MNKVTKYVTFNSMILLKLQCLIYTLHYNNGINYDIIAEYLEQNNDKLIDYLMTN